ncbi:MAG TPA: DNA polymerase III subunit beta [Candidatus Eisenbacteria bacterium]|nr:DNA polymerase III subunit beta [Candidatus Eisenbacteria bacterium]
MKFSVAQTELLQALHLISSAVPSRTTLPVLSNILVEAGDGALQLTATDLDLSISTKATAEVKADGSLTVPARKLFDLVKKLPKEELKLEAKDLALNVVSKTGRFKFLCIRPEEFPARPTVAPDVHVTVDAKAFERLVRRTVYAVSTDETRPALNGALFQMAEGEIRLVATDGHRLAKATLKHPAATKGALKGDVILPLKALNHLARLLPEAGDNVGVELSKTHARFVLGNTTLTTKLIEGPFPNYEQVLPKNNTKHLTVSRDALSSALDRVSVFSDSLTKQVKFSISKNRLRLVVQTPDQGEATEDLDVKYDADDLDIGYNAVYLLDILKTMDSEEVLVQLNTPVTAGLLVPAPSGESKAPAVESLLCLVMPLRLAG